jgi:hypothetical protein
MTPRVHRLLAAVEAVVVGLLLVWAAAVALGYLLGRV